MNDPLLSTFLVIAAAVLSAWFTLYHCADAELHGNRQWWRKALFRARQRAEYKEFSLDVEQQHAKEQEYAQRQKEEE